MNFYTLSPNHFWAKTRVFNKHFPIILLTLCSSYLQLLGQRVIINFNTSLRSAPNLTTAALKYDKDFAYSFTFDDASEDPYTCALPIFKGGVVKAINTTYPGMFYTDGCGNQLPFKAGLAWNSANRSNMDIHLGNVPGQMTWAQLNEMMDNNWDVYNHSYSHLAMSEQYLSPSDYNAQISLNEDAIQKNTKTGFHPPFFVIPSGDVNYYQYAFGQGYKAVFNQNGNDQGILGVNVDEDVDFSKGIFRGNLDETLFNGMFDNIFVNANPQNHLWYNEFCHRIDNFSGGGLNFYTFFNYMQTIEQKYGAKGSDRVWMAPLQEVAEYLLLKKTIKYTAQVSNNKLILDFDLSQVPTWLKRRAITFKFDGSDNIQSIDLPSGGNATFNNTGKRIINIDLNGVALPIFNCPTLQKNIGDSCDDGNSNTSNDKVQSDCTCKGTTTTASNITVQCPADITVNLVNSTSTLVKWQEPTVTSTCVDNSGSANCGSQSLAGYKYLGTFNSKMYFISNQITTNATAQTQAKNAGAKLINIESKAECDYLNALLSNNTVAFIGANKDVNGNWVNTSGANLNFTNWENGYPITSNATLTSAVLATWAQGRWLNVSPSAEYPSVIEFICTSNNKILASQISGPANNTTLGAGNYTIAYSATDKCANSGSCKFNLSVIDKTTPTSPLSVQLTTSSPTYSTNTPLAAQIILKNNSNTDYTNIKLQFPYPSGVVTGGGASTTTGVWQEYCFGNVRCYLWNLPSLKANSQAILSLPLFMTGSDPIVSFSANVLESTPALSPLPSASSSLSLVLNSQQLAQGSKLSAQSSKTIGDGITAIYPNPTEESVSVIIKSSAAKQIGLQFFDLNGKVIYQQKLALQAGSNTFEFDVSDWHNGVYFILGGRQYSGTFLKN